MVSRERLRLVAEHVVRLMSERRVWVVAQLLLASGLVFVALRLRSIWRDSHIELSKVGWGWLGGSLALAISAVLASAFIWLEILRLLGVTPRPSWATVYLRGQLGKYVPGSVWQYASRGALATNRGIPLRVVAKSFPIELSATVLAAAAFSILLVGWWGAVAVIAVVAAAAGATSALHSRIAARAASKAVLLYVGTWVLIGGSFWMAARGLVQIPAGQLPVYMGGFASAWIVGLVAIYAPTGIGVREAVLVAILRSRVGTEAALVVALGSRIVFMLADLVAASLSVLTIRGSDRTPAEQVERA
jgi:glycosyltransferase 2 family protein